MKTEREIENQLRNAPAPEPPADLRGKLKNAIRLGKAPNGSALNLGASLWRRWLPGLSYAILILGCVVVLAVQHHQQGLLLQQIEELRRDIGTAEELEKNRRNSEQANLGAATRMKDLLANATEADRLALRLAELNETIERLTAEAANLETQMAAGPTTDADAPIDFFHDPEGPMQQAREEGMTLMCISNLKQIGLAARIWAGDHSDVFPPTLNAMSNELSVAKVLCCPKDVATKERIKELSTQAGGDRIRWPNEAWSKWPLNGGSYEFLAPNYDPQGANFAYDILARCRFHGHVVMCDGGAHRIDSPTFPNP